ncbi:hypothetical protein B0H63DRAFT_62884 [Podospora didyma]|uniref:AAA+ ATPase domain-containing protein n=1 Tax=Podospora didyma TaxID=330526 RepID=A0AAE0P7X9_9PEZI|nr:hypothetical protein B0H63DRAFT_62884 [Podospora didyma]
MTLRSVVETRADLKKGFKDVKMVIAEQLSSDNKETREMIQESLNSKSKDIIDAIKRLGRQIGRDSSSPGNSSSKKGPVDAASRNAERLAEVRQKLMLQGCYDFSSQQAIQQSQRLKTIVRGTFRWIFRDENCKSVMTTSELPAFLWISGDPGMGKTALAAKLIDYAQRKLTKDAGTSLAYFFFGDDHGDCVNDVKSMIGTCVMQVATDDIDYRKAVLQSEIAPEPGTDDQQENGVVRAFGEVFSRIYHRDSKKRLILVLDDVDAMEATDSGEGAERVKQIKEILSNIHDTGARIVVLFTSSPSFLSDSDGDISRRYILLDKPRLEKDMLRIAIDTSKASPRLSRLGDVMIRKIGNAITNKADNLTYIKHMIRRLNDLGREKPIRAELKKLPESSAQVFELMLAHSAKHRDKKSLKTLKILFAWLAFAKSRLTLGMATSLIEVIGSDGQVDIEDELESRSANLLRLLQTSDSSSNSDGEDEDSAPSDSDESHGDPQQTTVVTSPRIDSATSPGLVTATSPGLVDATSPGIAGAISPGMDSPTPPGEKAQEAKEDDDDDEEEETYQATLLAFQDSSLRSFFRETDHDESSESGEYQLRSSPVTANILIVQSIADILRKLGGKTPDFKLSVADLYLTSYAANYWVDHLLSLQAEKLTLAQCREVIKSVYIVLTDIYAIRALERMVGYRVLYKASQTIFAVENEQEIGNVLEQISTLARRAEYTVNDAPPVEMAEWLHEVGRRPWSVFLTIGSNHAKNWAQNALSPESRWPKTSFMLAHAAMIYAKDEFATLPPEVKTYCDAFDMANPTFTKESVDMVSRAFPNSWGGGDEDRLSRRLLSEAIALMSQANGPGIGEFDEGLTRAMAGLDYATDDFERCELLFWVSTALIELAIKIVPDAVGTEDDVANQAKRREMLNKVIATSETAEALLLRMLAGPEISLERQRKLNVASETVSYMVSNRIRAGVMLGEVEDALRLAAQIVQAGNPFEFYWSDTFDLLVETKRWPEVIRLVAFLKPETQEWIVTSSDMDHVLEAASRSGLREELFKVLSQVRKHNSFEPGDGDDWDLSIAELRFHLDVKGDFSTVRNTAQEALQRRENFNKDGMFDELTTIQPFLSRSLIEAFRHETKVEAKRAAFDDLKALLDRLSIEGGAGNYDQAASALRIPLALMARKLESGASYQAWLDESFHTCLGELRDNILWNDIPSLRSLAKVLAAAPGGNMFQRDVRIATACQFYNLTTTTSNSATAEPDEASAPKVVPAGGSEAGNKPDPKKDAMDIAEGGRECDICMQLIEFPKVVSWMCLYCPDVDICQQCWERKFGPEAGKDEKLAANGETDHWKITRMCDKTHPRIRTMSLEEGWVGVKDGVLKIQGEPDVSFSEWLEAVETKWKSAWVGFWSEEMVHLDDK